MALLDVGLTNISIVNVSFEDDDPQTIMAWCNRYKQLKAGEKFMQKINSCNMAFKKVIGLLHVRICKKEIETFFIDKKWNKLK